MNLLLYSLTDLLSNSHDLGAPHLKVCPSGAQANAHRCSDKPSYADGWAESTGACGIRS